MSRAHASSSSPAPRRPLAGLTIAALGVGAALVLTGCGAGQITQTDTQQSAVNAASGQVGAMALRGVELKAPSDPKGVYAPGSDAPLVVTIVNNGLASDTLTGVTTPAALSVTIDGSPTGTKDIAGGFAVSGGSDTDGEGSAVDPQSSAPSSSPAPNPAGAPPSGNSSSVPSAGAAPKPVTVGSIAIVLTGMKSVNGAPLTPGETIPITFTFAHAGEVTIQVPIGAPSDKQSEAAVNEGAGVADANANH